MPCGREARGRIDPADARADAPHALHRHRKVDLDVVRRPGAVVGGVAHLGVQARRADQGLRGHAAVVQAVAAEQVAFDQRDPRAQRGGAARCDQSRRPGADDQQVVGVARPRVAPIRRPGVVAELAVVRALGRLLERRMRLRHALDGAIAASPATANRREIPRGAGRSRMQGLPRPSRHSKPGAVVLDHQHDHSLVEAEECLPISSRSGPASRTVGLKPLARTSSPESLGPAHSMLRSAGSAISGANTSDESVDAPADRAVVGPVGNAARGVAVERLAPPGDEPRLGARAVACRQAPAVGGVAREAVRVADRVLALNVGRAAAVLEIVTVLLAHEAVRGCRESRSTRARTGG